MAGTLCAIFGGTFDPIHYGHLHVVEALAQQVNLARVTFMPNNVPPHRPQPQASSAQRAAMVALAIQDNPLFDIDDSELQRSSPSYTVETLAAWRAEHGDTQPLAFIIGEDSLLSLPSWHQYQRLLTLSHILVCRRPGYDVNMGNDADRQWLSRHITDDKQRLHSEPAGCIWLADTPLYPISATAIRQRLQHGESCQDWLSPAVEDYIFRHRLYGMR